MAQIQKNDVQKRVDRIYGIEDIYAHSKLELAKASRKKMKFGLWAIAYMITKWPVRLAANACW